MSYARITRINPLPGRAAEVLRLLNNYMEWLVTRPGFVLGMTLMPGAETHPVARVTVWERSSDADATAVEDHALAVRSQIIALTRDQEIHEEEFSVESLQRPNWA